jgi:hypothetical protein
MTLDSEAKIRAALAVLAEHGVRLEGYETLLAEIDRLRLQYLSALGQCIEEHSWPGKSCDDVRGVTERTSK